MTAEEAAELDLTQEEAICPALGLRFLSFPIPDRSTPLDHNACAHFIRQLAKLYTGGDKIVIHCRGGIGRASLIAAGVLIATGFPASEALLTIAACRGCTVPDTPEQAEWVAQFAKELD